MSARSESSDTCTGSIAAPAASIGLLPPMVLFDGAICDFRLGGIVPAGVITRGWGGCAGEGFGCAEIGAVEGATGSAWDAAGVSITATAA